MPKYEISAYVKEGHLAKLAFDGITFTFNKSGPIMDDFSFESDRLTL